MAFKRVIIRRVGPLSWLLDGLELFNRAFLISRLLFVSFFLTLPVNYSLPVPVYHPVPEVFINEFGPACRRPLVLVFLQFHYGRKLRPAVAAQALPALCFRAMTVGEPVISFLRLTYRAMF